MTFFKTLIFISFLGLVNALYLTYKHYFTKKPLVCPINHDCNAVLNSKWGHIFGIRNEILGVLFYGGMLVGSLLLFFSSLLIPNLLLYVFIGSITGVLFSIFLVALQKFVIHDFCFYCLISAGLSTLLFINSTYLFLHQ